MVEDGDEPLDEVMAAFDAATDRGVTEAPVGWYCEHMSVTSAGGVITTPVPGCGCVMTPVRANRPACVMRGLD